MWIIGFLRAKRWDQVSRSNYNQDRSYNYWRDQRNWLDYIMHGYKASEPSNLLPYPTSAQFTQSQSYAYHS